MTCGITWNFFHRKEHTNDFRSDDMIIESIVFRRSAPVLDNFTLSLGKSIRFIERTLFCGSKNAQKKSSEKKKEGKFFRHTKGKENFYPYPEPQNWCYERLDKNIPGNEPDGFFIHIGPGDEAQLCRENENQPRHKSDHTIITKTIVSAWKHKYLTQTKEIEKTTQGLVHNTFFHIFWHITFWLWELHPFGVLLPKDSWIKPDSTDHERYNRSNDHKQPTRGPKKFKKRVHRKRLKIDVFIILRFPKKQSQRVKKCNKKSKVYYTLVMRKNILRHIPNALTCLRIIGSILVFTWMIRQNFWIGYSKIIFLVCLVSTDWLDGFLARRYHWISKFGKIMDPIADKILLNGIMIAMIVLPELHLSWIGVTLILVREIGITIWRLVMARRDIIVPADSSGKIKTILQMLLCIFGCGWIFGIRHHFWWMDHLYQNGLIGLFWIIVLITVGSWISILVKFYTTKRS